MLSRNEVWEAQKSHAKMCQDCSHKPIDDFCREQLVFGEQRMDWCDDWRPLNVDLGNATGAVQVYEPWYKTKNEKKPARKLRPVNGD